MSKPGEFPHHEKNGAWVVKPITARTVADRIMTPAKPRKHATDEMLGKTVTAHGRQGGPGGYTYGNPVERITGQVWCAASTDTGHGPGWWWIVSEGRYLVAHESSFSVVAERTEDVSLFEEESVA